MTGPNYAARPLVIFGSAEIARLARFYFEADGGRKVAAFTIDDAYIDSDTVEDLPLVPFSKATEAYPPDRYDAPQQAAPGKIRAGEGGGLQPCDLCLLENRDLGRPACR